MILLVLYVALLNLFPAELIPEFGEYRIAYWTGIIGLIVAGGTSLARGTLRLRSPILWLMCGLTATMMLSLIIADRWLGGILQVLNKFGISLTMFFLVCWSVTTLRRLRTVVFVTVICSLVLMTMGTLALHFGIRKDIFVYVYNAESEDDPGMDENGVPVAPRIQGVGNLSDPNDLALAFVVCLPLIGVTWRPGRTFRNVLLVIIPMVGLGYGVYLTRSRGGALAALFVIVLLSAKRLAKGTGVWLLAALAGIFLVLGATSDRAISVKEESAAARIEAWSEGLALLRTNPVTGIGFKNFTDYHELTAHNSFVLCLSELGILGYCLWLGMIILTIRNLKQLARAGLPADGKAPPLHHAEIARWATALEIGMYGFLCAGFFLSRAYTPTLFLLLGMGVCLTDIGREAGITVGNQVGKILFRITPAAAMASIVLLYGFMRLHRLLYR
jgi:putative inorganic carbon (HCO3(-)) transporter